jgi:hypothetical protein
MQTKTARLLGRAFLLIGLVVAAAVIFSARSSSTSRKVKNTAQLKTGADAGEQVVVAAGDIVDCKNLAGSEATAKLIDDIPGTVLALGDLAYPDGSESNFKCYEKTWGRHKARTRPAPGNHEHHAKDAAAYFKYFGEAAGSPGHSYYSFDLGAWHVISLDSECAKIGGCQEGSAEEVWLRQDLQRNASSCVLAFWHVPRFSSGAMHGNSPEMKPFWDDLYAAGADVILGGHDHDYERFAPQTPDGAADPEHGIREFVVGTGGKNQRGFRSPSANSEVRSNTTFGVLKLTLRSHDYEWKFISVAGGQFSDAGNGTCHARPAK